ncbi:rhodanese-like domain-containing protein [Pontibacter sp. G13]|uniref:rhodanese-like domain-containing protein n=1 Tax=Pontibacter sp. G13 TaxID=3074898 RepID=UPI00288B8A0A|nr:rhodanese-like domain-containing protein [Pontibacter sp. G13]WNJ18820.1 rhodanese-like domain-containing protein [Pontibacter sp. G13]
MNDITSRELKERIDAGTAPVMIDVREPHEWDRQHLDGVKTISLSTIPAHLPELEALKGEEVVLICRSGGRSGQATQFLRSKGFSNARNLIGGMLGWKAEIDPEFDVD